MVIALRVVGIDRIGDRLYRVTTSEPIQDGSNFLPICLMLERVLWQAGLVVLTIEVPPGLRKYRPPGPQQPERPLPALYNQIEVTKPRDAEPLPTAEQINVALQTYRPPLIYVFVNPLNEEGHLLVVMGDEDDRFGRVAQAIIASVDGVEEILPWDKRPRSLRGYHSSTAMVARIRSATDPDQLESNLRDALGAQVA